MPFILLWTRDAFHMTSGRAALGDRYGNRERDLRNGFSISPEYTPKLIFDSLCAPAWTWDMLANEPMEKCALTREDIAAPALSAMIKEQLHPAFTWSEAEWLVSEWGGPAAIKGIVRPDDAVRALDSGFSTLWLSNHGGRQLDGTTATVSVLSAVREAVGPGAEIILDGGCQRGTDVAKALALGADGVGLGKAYLYGLGAGGEAGVHKALEIMKVELERTMGLMGVGTLAELKRRGPDLVRHRGMSARDAQGARYAPGLAW